MPSKDGRTFPFNTRFSQVTLYIPAREKEGFGAHRVLYMYIPTHVLLTLLSYRIKFSVHVPQFARSSGDFTSFQFCDCLSYRMIT